MPRPDPADPVAAPGGFALAPSEHHRYRTLSRHGNPYLVTDRRVLGILGPAPDAGPLALADIESMQVGRGLLHQDSYWTVSFRGGDPNAPHDPVMFFRTKAAEDLVREVDQARAIAPAAPAARERSRPWAPSPPS